MTKSQQAFATFKSSGEYEALVKPTDDKAKTVTVAELEARVRRAFAAGWVGDRVNLSTLLDELVGSSTNPDPKKR